MNLRLFLEDVRAIPTFDPEAFYQYVTASLPPYARPLFIRLVPKMEVTGTLKQRKIDLHRDGYDPGRVKPDPVYFRDDEARRYVRLEEGSLKI